MAYGVMHFLAVADWQVALHAPPADQREQFKVWFQQQDQPPVVAQLRREAPRISNDLSVPDFLKHEPVPQEVAS
jgi:hypothetical protein